ncbi:MAG: thioredoxin family protein [Acidimicrobiia bacterium]
MDVTLLYFDGCPNWRNTERQLVELSSDFGFEVTHKLVGSADEAQALAFRGSPTVLIDGVDPFSDDKAPVGLTCRLYATPEGIRGAPSLTMLREALTR